MDSGFNFLFSGTILGLSAGLSPGPLMTLVISETLKHRAGEGVKVALSPLVTDLPIILLTVFVLGRLSDTLPLLGTISIMGGIFILYLAWESLRFSGADITQNSGQPPHSLAKGVAANLLNPHPYLFWLTIGGPLMMKSGHDSLLNPCLYLVAFYFFLVGSKMAVALAVGKSKGFLRSSAYVYTIRALGVILIGFSVLFFKTGFTHLGWL